MYSLGSFLAWGAVQEAVDGPLGRVVSLMYAQFAFAYYMPLHPFGHPLGPLHRESAPAHGSCCWQSVMSPSHSLRPQSRDGLSDYPLEQGLTAHRPAGFTRRAYAYFRVR